MERLQAEFNDRTARFEQPEARLTGDNPDRYGAIAAASPGDVDAEVRHLLGVLRPWQDQDA
jgi:hypothetical protein